MILRDRLLFVPIMFLACGAMLMGCGGEPQAKAPAAAAATPSASADSTDVPPSIAEGQQATMKEDAEALKNAKAALEEALGKSDCKAKCDAFNEVGAATKRLCYTAVTDDDQRQCKEAKGQLVGERERAEKSCEPCPPLPEKRRHRRKAK